MSLPDVHLHAGMVRIGMMHQVSSHVRVHPSLIKSKQMAWMTKHVSNEFLNWMCPAVPT